MENPLEEKTSIIFNTFHVLDKDGNRKEEYREILERASLLVDDFNKEYPKIVATYAFEHISNQFSLLGKEGRHYTEESICLDFLIRLNN
tara:strand:+ start:58 stop:324 length:267 start_codon:yes stop_codon:yes gene_type:complete